MMPELRNWQIVSNGRAQFAIGYLYGDPHVADGTHIRTGRILELLDSAIRTAAKTYATNAYCI